MESVNEYVTGAAQRVAMAAYTDIASCWEKERCRELWRWVAIGVLILVVTDIARRRRKGGGGNKEEEGRIGSPPVGGGLFRFPWVGHLPQLLLLGGGLPHKWFYELSRRTSHGAGGSFDFFMLWLGRIPVLVVSSAPAARLILHDHDIAFASRPSTSASRTLLYNSSDLSFCPYGPYWRKVKELVMSNLFNSTRTLQSSPLRSHHLSLLISNIHSHVSSPQHIRSKVEDMSLDIMCMMIFGMAARDLGVDFLRATSDLLELLGVLNIGDFLPAIRWLDLQGYERRIKETRKNVDEKLQRIIDECRRGLEARKDSSSSMNNCGQHKIFLDVLLMDFDHDIDGSKPKDDCIKAILVDALIGGRDTISISVEWALSELLRHPEIMTELQQELDNVLGRHCLMEESYIPKLPFLQTVVKETFRLHPPGPLLVPRETRSPQEIRGYYVAEKTRVFVNAWGIGRDESVWEKPFDFRPHRFLNSTMDVKGHHYELLPFGAGRRACPAMNLGLVSFQLILATLVHCFEWSLPDGIEEIDMKEKFGLTLTKLIPLVVKPTPRLPKECYEFAS